jgi:hypothetical protein
MYLYNSSARTLRKTPYLQLRSLAIDFILLSRERLLQNLFTEPLFSNEYTCYNIRMDLRKVGRGGTDWIDLAQDRDQWRALVNTVIKFHVP